MKRMVAVIIIAVVAIALVYVITCTDLVISITRIIEGNTKLIETAEHKGYYYFRLNEHEKEIYESIYAATDRMENQAVTVHKEPIDSPMIERAMLAFIYDYPEFFYLDTNYRIKIKQSTMLSVVTVSLEYLFDKTEVVALKNNFQNKIQEIINDIINQEASDYDKELAIHDYIASNVKYYSHSDISDVPNIMHTSYNALINNIAVCDGITKAFTVLANRVGLTNVIVEGNKEGVAHTWNIVSVEGDYYNLDVTADMFVTKDDKLVPIHAYFNVLDEEISKDYVRSTSFELPLCTATKHNYYIKNNLLVKDEDSLKNLLKNAISTNKSKEVLEIKIIGVEDATQKYANALYSLNFNSYKTKGTTEINYSRTNDVFIVEKQ